MTHEELRDLLERLHDKYNRAEFVENDPISIPHLFSGREDIEISGLLAATIAWGNRKAIVKSARRMVEYMDSAPYDFTMNASEAELDRLGTYVHRTFNGSDFRSFVVAMRRMYAEEGGIGGFFERRYAATGDMRVVLSEFRRAFFAAPHDPHCCKHISSIDKGAACKRLNMYLRWLVRRDNRGVDFGLWESIPMCRFRTLGVDSDVGAISAAGRAFGEYGTCIGLAHTQAERLESGRTDHRNAARI